MWHVDLWQCLSGNYMCIYILNATLLQKSCTKILVAGGEVEIHILNATLLKKSLIQSGWGVGSIVKKIECITVRYQSQQSNLRLDQKS